jgi:hypothetical protein
MSTVEIDNTILDGYSGLLNNLSAANKLDLIARLTAAVKTDLTTKRTTFKLAFGAFDSAKTAEEIITDIRSSRVSTRKNESF